MLSVAMTTLVTLGVVAVWVTGICMLVMQMNFNGKAFWWSSTVIAFAAGGSVCCTVFWLQLGLWLGTAIVAAICYIFDLAQMRMFE